MCGGGGSASVEKAGKYERTLVDLSRKRLDEYKELYVPLENDRIAKARGANSASKVQTYTNDAVASSRLKTAQGGVAPVVGGKLATVMGSQGGHQAAGLSAAMGKQVAEDDYSNRMLEMVNIGRQQSGDSVKTMGSVASREVSNNIASASADHYVNNAKYGMYGTIAGAGAGWANEKYDPFGLKD